ncbi:MAG: lytic transglycosylase domain-containing protein, partial [Pseudomonadota bacterium]
MSSMPSKMLRTPLVFASILTASAAAIAAPLSAQSGGQSADSSLVAMQPRGIEQAIGRWEYLQKTRGLGFADYAGFAAAFPDFPRMSIIRIRAENALDSEAPSAADLIRYFDAVPPLTNSGRARYALALAGAQRPEAFDMARAAWRGGSMSGPAEAYLLGLFGSRFST